MKKKSKPTKLRSLGESSPPKGPVFFQHPLSTIPREKLIPGLVEYAKTSASDFKTHLDAVVEILCKVEPLQAIASLATYGLFSSVGKDGERSRPKWQQRFGQSHVELVQALLLTIPATNLKINPPHPTDIQKLMDVLPELSESFAHRRMVIMEQERSEQQKAIIAFQESLRLHTQNVRNWGYFDDVVRISSELYAPLDEDFEKAIGIKATKILAAFLFMLRTTEQRINTKMKILAGACSQKNIGDMVRKYYELSDFKSEKPEKMIEYVNQQGLDYDQVKYLIISHIEYALSDAFIFSSSTVASDLSVSDKAVSSLFGELSLLFGDLKSTDLEYLFLDNPVWTKPLIRIDESEFFCPIPQAFFSFVRPAMDALINRHPAVKLACDRRRAEFLECESARLFSKAFPGAEVVAGYSWTESGVEFENDLLVRIDSHLLIIEAKSGTVSWPALRGAPDSMKRRVEDLLIEPSLQSARLADRIKRVIANPDMKLALLPGLNLQIDRVHIVLRLSITLEDFAMTQANLSQLSGTGWLPEGHSLAPCILITDLNVIFDILESTGQKLNYLRRRTELATSGLVTMGDELDHLGLYLANGFNLGEAEQARATLQLLEMSDKIDSYCTARAEGISVRKPTPFLGHWWGDICKKVEERHVDRWTEMYEMLLTVSPNEQRTAEEMFEKIKKKVMKNWRHPSHHCTVTITPLPHKSVGIALYAFKGLDRNARREKMNAIAAKLFESSHVTRCLIIAIDIDRGDYPYTAMAVLDRGDDAKPQTLTDLVAY
jgi:hypothetical protein